MSGVDSELEVVVVGGGIAGLTAAVELRARGADVELLEADPAAGGHFRSVMTRAQGPRMTLMARAGDRPAGVAFVAVDGAIAMIHAIEVTPEHRRKGAGAVLMRSAASFAAEHGAAWLALAVTKANAPARALYERLGIARAGSYHYRVASG